MQSYNLISLGRDSRSNLPTLNSGSVFPGSYALVSNNGPVLSVTHQPLPIIPRGNLKSKSSSTPGSPSSIKKRTHEESEVRIEFGSYLSQLLNAVLESNDRDSLFSQRIYQRDSHCLITKEFKNLEASHIIAHAWWRKHRDRRECLPLEIRNLIQGLEGKIDNLTNGILLRTDLSKAFDAGDISFVYERGHFYVVAISPTFNSIDGKQLDEHLRKRADGSFWWSPETCPNPWLVKFHLQNSVFAHCKGGGESDDDDVFDDPDVLVNRLKLLDYFNGSYIGEKLARSVTVETLVELCE